jgi:acyl carrier protein
LAGLWHNRVNGPVLPENFWLTDHLMSGALWCGSEGTWVLGFPGVVGGPCEVEACRCAGGRVVRDALEVTQLEAVINDYISRELVQDATLLPLSNTTPLLDTGILDSLTLLRLKIFVEERFGIAVDAVDLIPENFASVETICVYLRSRAGQGAGQPAGH